MSNSIKDLMDEFEGLCASNAQMFAIICEFEETHNCDASDELWTEFKESGARMIEIKDRIIQLTNNIIK